MIAALRIAYSYLIYQSNTYYFMRRAASMINRVCPDGTIVFTGGVAKNPCMITLLEGKLGQKLQVPDDPQLVGALGAALLVKEQSCVS